MGNSPPPSGVFGCGASTIASPGVNICPLMIVKFWARAVAATMSAASAVESRGGINIISQKLHLCQLKPLRREQFATIVREDET